MAASMRYAVFVDAGYLFAQSSKALAGETLQRDQVDLDMPAVIRKLRITADDRAPDANLLRIYWYDGLVRGNLSPQQEELAFTEDVKLRLGIVTPTGRQKGVDSLIVTDLVELARNGAITDVVMLSGDEDLRIGVQIAQSFGVRVHLIGIQPSRGSQSLTLLQESDTTTEWKRADVDEFMAMRTGYEVADQALNEEKGSTLISEDTESALGEAIDGFVSSLSSDEILMVDSLGAHTSIPKAIDSRLLATCRSSLARDLEHVERSEMRQRFREVVRKRSRDT